MRVDDVPPWFQPAFQCFAHGTWGLLELLTTGLRRGVAIERPPPSGSTPRIECFWHEHLPMYIATYLPPRDGRRYVWMNHPTWYMAPVHHLLRHNGVEELALGSTGHGGQAALDRVVDCLRSGLSTALAVDGPAGPPHVLKRGALDMALSSGCDVVAIRFEYERAVRLPGWDAKYAPMPGSRVRIFESEPRRVNAENYSAERERLLRELG